MITLKISAAFISFAAQESASINNCKLLMLFVFVRNSSIITSQKVGLWRDSWGQLLIRTCTYYFPLNKNNNRRQQELEGISYAAGLKQPRANCGNKSNCGWNYKDRNQCEIKHGRDNDSRTRCYSIVTSLTRIPHGFDGSHKCS